MLTLHGSYLACVTEEFSLLTNCGISFGLMRIPPFVPNEEQSNRLVVDGLDPML